MTGPARAPRPTSSMPITSLSSSQKGFSWLKLGLLDKVSVGQNQVDEESNYWLDKADNWRSAGERQEHKQENESAVSLHDLFVFAGNLDWKYADGNLGAVKRMNGN